MSYIFREPDWDDRESIDPARPWIGHPREAEFERFVAEQEKLQAACTCEWDGGYGDDGSEVRREPKLGCPAHTEEDRDAGRILGCEICYRDFLADDVREIPDPNGESSLGFSENLVLYACEPCARKRMK